ncbi:MAG: type II toxin-antitoxin system HicA family toxin [Clostridiales bacterium]|jgi:predicted RNA binding protein YcfA (HicA-like mRNA interferase family)|nr:type II toxin-antitoxin system HicA family toxin [Clostridiales bacterium]
MTVREVEKIIKADGWYEIRSNNGSHRQFKHNSKKGKVTIPQHSGDIPQGTLNNIFKQAGLK